MQDVNNQPANPVQHQAQDADGNWHNVTGFQAAAFRLDGVPVRAVPADK